MDRESNSNSNSETEQLSSASLKIHVIGKVKSGASGGKSRKESETKTSSGFWGNFKGVISNIDVEPVHFLYNVVFQIALIIVIDFLYYQSCTVNQQMSEEYCTRNKTKDYLVAENVADIKIWQEVVDNICQVLLSLFLGAWGDRYGRKLPILIVLSGNIIQAAGILVIHLGFGQVTSVEVTAILAILPIALTGQMPVMLMAVYSYAADSSSIKQRTLKIGVLSTAASLGKSAGSAVVGVLKKQGHGYALFFSLIGGLQVISFVYTLLVLKNNPSQQEGQGQGQRSNETTSCAGMFSLRHVAETAKCFFKQRERRIRLHVFLIAIFIVLASILSSGERVVLQQFTFKQLNWTTSDFSFFFTFQQLFLAFGGILILSLLTQVFKLQDSSIGILAAISKICGSFIYAFADRTWIMYLAAVVSIADKSLVTASRSMLSKIVPKHEFGKVLSFTTVFISFSQLATDPLYATVFRLTLATFTGSFFFISAAVAFFILIINMYFYLCSRSVGRNKKNEVSQDF